MAGEKTYIDTSRKGAVNGVASLDANSEIPNVQRPTTPDTKRYVRKWTNIMKHG